MGVVGSSVECTVKSRFAVYIHFVCEDVCRIRILFLRLRDAGILVVCVSSR